MPPPNKSRFSRALFVAFIFVCVVAVYFFVTRELKARRLAEMKTRKNLNGLVAWWPGDGDAVDAISGVTGHFQNGVKFAPGVSHEAFDFAPDAPGSLTDRLRTGWSWLLRLMHRPAAITGGMKHVRVPDRPELHLTNGMTLSAWICPSLIWNFEEVIGKWNAVYPDPNPQDCYTLAVVPDGRIYGGVSPTANGTGSTSVYGNAPLPQNTWTHVALTYDGMALNIYVNGRLQNSQPYTNGIYPGDCDLGIGAVVGHAAAGQCGSPFIGKIADVSIYNRPLSPGEIQADYTAGKTVVEHKP